MGKIYFKYFVLFSFLLLFYSTLNIPNFVFSQTQWALISNKKPLVSVNILSQTNSFIYGGDIVYKSTDGGDTWGYPIAQYPQVGSENYYSSAYGRICFVDSLYGWAISLNNWVFNKTINGGVNWNYGIVGSKYYRLNTIKFINRNTGWVAGIDSSNHILISKSINGGQNWSFISNDLKFEPSQIYMINENKGFAIPKYSSTVTDSLAYTNNGGVNWTYQKVGNGYPLVQILFNDSQNGWLLGFMGSVSRTTNGGTTWNVYPNFVYSAHTLFFLNNMTGWVTASSNQVWKTTDGGITFIQQLVGTTSNNYYAGIYFINPNTGWASNSNGTAIKTINGGNNWVEVINSPSGLINHINFVDLNTGWTINSQNIFKTTNGGVVWITQNTFSNNINYVKFINNNTGFVLGNGGLIFKSTNGGSNWNQSINGSATLYSLFFINSNTGWCCGTGGQIYKTTNTGENWFSLNSGVTRTLNSVFATDINNLHISTGDSLILNSTNGGLNWSSVGTVFRYNYARIFFVNSNTGFTIGNIGTNTSPQGYPVDNMIALKTTNAGLNWTTSVEESYIGTGRYYKSLSFTDDLNGWITNSYGGIKRTTNGGTNWFIEGSPNTGKLTCINIVNGRGWISGDSGKIMMTITPTVIRTINSEIPKHFYLKQNYPNPFNATSIIRFDVPLLDPKGTLLLHRNDVVVLKIYDITGREIVTLVNEVLQPGTYETTFDASILPSGVYFYKLSAGVLSETKRMVIIK